MRKKEFYLFRNEYWGSDWQEIKSTAYNEEDLALEIAEGYWSDDPTDPDRFEFYIEIKKGRDGEVKMFKITAEANVDFYARKLYW